MEQNQQEDFQKKAEVKRRRLNGREKQSSMDFGRLRENVNRS